jgi:hypothetical protein
MAQIPVKRLAKMIDRAIGIGGVAVSIIFGVLLVVFPKINKKVGWAGIAFGILLLGAAIVMAFLPDGKAQSPPSVSGNCNNFGNNNFNCNTLNIVPPRTLFTNELGRDLLAHMPTKKPVSLKTVGASADQKIGDDVQEFLQKNGYTVNRMSIGMIAPPPDHPFSFLDTINEYIITVAPSAR